MADTTQQPTPQQHPDPPQEATLVSDGVDGVRTTRMLERAVRNRWPIPEKYKEAIIKRQVAIAVDAKSKPREASAAARTILAADKLNQADEHEANKEPEQHIHLHQQVPHSKIFFDLPPLENDVSTQPSS